MAYQHLHQSLNREPILEAPGSVLWQSARIARPFRSLRQQSYADELPLLDVGSSAKRPATRHGVTRAMAATDSSDYYTKPVFGLNGDYTKLSDSGGSSFLKPVRDRIQTWSRYIRASGPANLLNLDNNGIRFRGRQMPTGWRLGTWVCCFAVVICVLLELALLVYATKTSSDRETSGILMEGNCKEVRELEIWLLLPLNLIGTALIGTSNYVMQVMTAPDRKEIDEAHSHARSIAVGGMRFKELKIRKGHKFRRMIWYTLGLSSVPIHFLLNVAVYSSVQASNTGVMVVSDDFENDTGWDHCSQLPKNVTSAETIACSLYRNHTEGLTIPLTTPNCLRQYSQGFQTNASSVIVVTNIGPRWFSPPIQQQKVLDSVTYGIPCGAKNKSCKYLPQPGSTSVNTSCAGGWVEVSDREYKFAYDPVTGYTNVSLNFVPFCNNVTIYNENNNPKTIDHYELQISGRSQQKWSYSSQDEIAFQENGTLSNISSIRAFFSAFQYQYWASASVTEDYLRPDYGRMLDNRDPRSWLCPRTDLEQSRLCNPLDLQRKSEWSITPESMPVNGCFVLPKKELCTLRYSLSILIITICFDLIKLSAMIAAVTRLSNPLTTLGDVIESFLRDPDPYTEGLDLLDDEQAEEYTRCARSRVGVPAYQYMKARFGREMMTRKTCPRCEKRWGIDGGVVNLNPQVLTDHRTCGTLNDGFRPASDFGEQCFLWLCTGGIWWTTIATVGAPQLPKVLKRRRWYEVPSARRWKWVCGLYVPALTLAITFFTVNYRSLLVQRLPQPWIVGFDAPDPNSMLTEGLSGTTSIYVAAMLVNAPQFAFSMLYFIFNATLTIMHTSNEWAMFSTHRKALRVSSPRGQQRATYWLQLPWTYSIPLIVASGSMHWLLSRSLYIVKVDVYGHLGEREVDKDYFACGYSPIPALMLIVILALMGFILFGLSLRWLPMGMPFVRLNSLSIAAACHANLAERDLETKPLMWGVIEGHSVDGNARCSFSSKDVSPVFNEKSLVDRVEESALKDSVRSFFRRALLGDEAQLNQAVPRWSTNYVPPE